MRIYIYVVIFLLAIGGPLGYQYFKRNQLIKNEGIIGIGTLLEIKTRNKGTTTRAKVALVEYFVDGVRFVESTPAFPNTKVGECYEIIYVPDSPNTVNINFNKKIDCPPVSKH